METRLQLDRHELTHLVFYLFLFFLQFYVIQLLFIRVWFLILLCFIFYVFLLLSVVQIYNWKMIELLKWEISRKKLF